MHEFCAKHEIRVERCGKVIVATTEAEVPRLMTLHARGIANGVPVELLEPARLSDFEPHARALRAIRSPSTGIVDYGEVAAAMARELQAAGVDRKSTRLNSSHLVISYAVFCLKKKINGRSCFLSV